ncbi:MAG: tyrosine-type recombinase/integrase [Magnetococcales bacterium]|nr:tyrosine-type recombinase/integrase [Magnetococcales bacterium]
MAAIKASFTASLLDRIQPPESGRVVYMDTKAPGLQLRVTTNGVKTFSWYRWVNGAPERFTLGRWPEMTIDAARQHVARLNHAKVEGVNPAAARRARKKEMTFGELFAVYLERWAKPRKKSWKGDEDNFRLHLSELATIPLSKVNRPVISTIHSRVGVEHPTTANRVLALVSTVFGRAKEWGLWEGDNPCEGVRRYPEKSRDRFFSEEELARFMGALQDEPPQMRAYFLLALLTGARRRDVFQARWEEIDLARAVWRIPDPKNGTPLTIPLVNAAVELLQGLERVETVPWIFPSPRSATGHLVEPRKAWERILERAGIENARIHDLRRSLGSHMAITGASMAIIGKTLGHKSQTATAVYARLSLDPVRAALEKATDAMMGKGKSNPEN